MEKNNNRKIKLDEINIKNFKSFTNFKMKLGKNGKTNLIYGDNGTGKSTFIEIFYFLNLIFEKRLIEEFS